MSDISRVPDRTDGFGLGVSHTGKPAPAPRSLLALLLCLVVLIIGVVTFNKYHYTSAIQRHGETQEAQVVDFYKHVYNGRLVSSCLVYGDILYTPRWWDRPIKLRMLLSGCDQRSRALSYAMQNHTLPIAYDTNDPRNTLVNFDNQVLRVDINANLKLGILLVIGVGTVCTAIFTLLSMARKD